MLRWFAKAASLAPPRWFNRHRHDEVAAVLSLVVSSVNIWNQLIQTGVGIDSLCGIITGLSNVARIIILVLYVEVVGHFYNSNDG